jgi:hypothetical protein
VVTWEKSDLVIEAGSWRLEVTIFVQLTEKFLGGVSGVK